MKEMKEIEVTSVEDAKSCYIEYMTAWREYTSRIDSPFNSPIKRSTFIRRLQSGAKIKIGETKFIPSPNLLTNKTE